jgi:hypothetical protein
MHYKIDYQFMSEKATRPYDGGTAVGIEATDRGGLVVLPNVGDFVNVDVRSKGAEFRGKVASRYFTYHEAGGEIICIVNIVVAEAPSQDWGKLLKE